MKPDHLLQRILWLARRAPTAEIPEMAFGLETAVLAHWREVSGENDAPNGTLLRGLRWAALLACAIALLAGVLEIGEVGVFADRFDPATRVADSAITIAYDYE
jgi:hypothetical protein